MVRQSNTPTQVFVTFLTSLVKYEHIYLSLSLLYEEFMKIPLSKIEKSQFPIKLQRQFSSLFNNVTFWLGFA